MLFSLMCLVGVASAHSWVEQLTVIAPNGTFVGDTGYPRANVVRAAPGFNDNLMVNLLPPNGRSNNSIFASDYMCKDNQRTQSQTSGSPRLQAAAGAKVALRYQENGHVTLPQNQPGKPANRGTMYVYGTTNPSPEDTFLSIHKVWNANGTGGDGRGVLLSTEAFDDGRCYQINGGSISVARQAKFPHEAAQPMGADIWCQQDIALPSNAPSGKPYTLYWVWDWPTAAGVDPGLPDGKTEIYTTCMDVDIQQSNSLSQKVVSAGFISDQNLNYAAIPSQFQNLDASPVANASAATVPGTQASTSTASGRSTIFTPPRTTSLTDAAATAFSSEAPSVSSVSTKTVTEYGSLAFPTVTLLSASTDVDTTIAQVTVYQTKTMTVYSAAQTGGYVRRGQVPIARASPSSSRINATPSGPYDVVTTTVVPVSAVTSTSTVIVHVPVTTSYHSPTLSATTISSTFQIRGRNPIF